MAPYTPSITVAEVAFVVWLGLAVAFWSWPLAVLAAAALWVARGRSWWWSLYWRVHRARRRRRGRRQGVVTEHPPGVPANASPEFDPYEPTLDV